MPWLIVLSDAGAARWVLEHETMAFRRLTGAQRPVAGERFAVYISRSAHHNPTRDEAQIVAVGTFVSEIEDRHVSVAGHEYALACELSIDIQLPLREGVPFRALVPKLHFIEAKKSWAAYVRRTLVPITDTDYDRIAAAVSKTARTAAATTHVGG